MDFIDRLSDTINEMEGLPIRLKKGYLGTGESFVIYPIAGSKTRIEFHDGTKDVDLNFELAMKSLDGDKTNTTLWTVQNGIEDFEEIISEDGSFEFDQITVKNKPYINQINEEGWVIFLIDITAQITVYK